MPSSTHPTNQMLKSTFGLATVNHQYSAEERQVLNSYQSLDYMPPHSKVYRNWLQQQPARLDWDRWLMMGLIGFAVGMLGFLLHQGSCQSVQSPLSCGRLNATTGEKSY